MHNCGKHVRSFQKNIPVCSLRSNAWISQEIDFTERLLRKNLRGKYSYNRSTAKMRRYFICKLNSTRMFKILKSIYMTLTIISCSSALSGSDVYIIFKNWHRNIVQKLCEVLRHLVEEHITLFQILEKTCVSVRSDTTSTTLEHEWLGTTVGIN